MNGGFEFNSFLPDARNRNWVNRIKERYQNPEQYRQHLKEQEDAHWEQSKTGGINQEMSKKLAEDKRQRKHEAQVREEQKRVEELGPNFPKVWDLNYVKEYPQKIFREKSDNK